jgi:rubredoxin
MKKWKCLICDYIYDEENGDFSSKIPPGTIWEDIDKNWCCPDCEATKEDFIEIENF